MRTKVVVVILCSLVLAMAVQAQEFWQKKDVTQWSESECKKLFNDSPWAKGHEVAFNTSDSVSARGNVRSSGGDVGSPQTGQNTGYVVAFWSAPPVRRAYVQFLKIRSKYDKMPADKKALADQELGRIISEEFPDSIVLRVSFYSTMKDTETAMASYWQQQTESSIKSSFYLIAHGQRVAPLKFAATPTDFTLVFPRQVNGEPVVKPGDKNMAVAFEHPSIGRDSSERVYIEFPMKKMLDEKGQLVF